jgi:hypothetical protein
MFTPSNFYTSNYASFDEAFGRIAPATSEITSKTNTVFKKIFDTYQCHSARIISTTEDRSEFIGTGQWIDPDHFLTAAHVVSHLSDSLSLELSSGDIINLDRGTATMNPKLDYALFTIKAPYSDHAFPEIASRNSSSSHLGMIRYSNSSSKPEYSVGSLGHIDQFEFRPTVDIGGGPGSSGACSFNEEGKLAYLHLSRKKGYETLRNQVHIQDILEDAALNKECLFGDRVVVTTIYTDTFFDEVPEAHAFDAMHETKSDTFRATNKVFQAAQEWIEAIRDERAFDFFSSINLKTKSIFKYNTKDKALSSLRMDIQSPADHYSNVQIQFENASIAGLLINKELCSFDKSDTSYIPEFSEFSLNELLKALAEAKTLKRVVMIRIDPKPTKEIHAKHRA